MWPYNHSLITTVPLYIGVPPFPVEKCISPLIKILHSDGSDENRLRILSTMSCILNSEVGDICSLQTKFLNLGVLGSLREFLEDVDDSNSEIIIRFIKDLSFKNGRTKVSHLIIRPDCRLTQIMNCFKESFYV